MKVLKTFILVLLFIVFVVAGGIFTLSKGIDKTFLDISFYEEVVEETEIASTLMSRLVGGIEEQAGSELQKLPAENRQQVKNILESSFSSALDEEWAEETLLVAVDDVLSYLKGEQEGLTAVIDLTEEKRVIQNNIQTEVEKSIQMEVEQQIQQRSDIPPGMEDQVRSRLESEIAPRTNTAVTGMMTGVPDRISLAQLLENLENSEEIKAAVATFQQVYSYFDLILYSTLIIFAILMLALAGFFGGLKWVGTGMIVSGGFLFLFLLALKPSLPVLLNNFNVPIDKQILDPVIHPLFFEMYTITLTYAGVGLLLLLIGIFSKKFKAREV